MKIKSLPLFIFAIVETTILLVLINALLPGHENMHRLNSLTEIVITQGVIIGIISLILAAKSFDEKESKIVVYFSSALVALVLIAGLSFMLISDRRDVVRIQEYVRQAKEREVFRLKLEEAEQANNTKSPE